MYWHLVDMAWVLLDLDMYPACARQLAWILVVLVFAYVVQYSECVSVVICAPCAATRPRSSAAADSCCLPLCAMSTQGGAGETAPYAEFNVHIHECVDLASEVVGSVVDGVEYRAKQKRGDGRNSKRKRARNRPRVFKVSALSQASADPEGKMLELVTMSRCAALSRTAVLSPCFLLMTLHRLFALSWQDRRAVGPTFVRGGRRRARWKVWSTRVSMT